MGQFVDEEALEVERGRREILDQARFWYPLLVERKSPREIREQHPDLPRRVWDQWVTDDNYGAVPKLLFQKS